MKTKFIASVSAALAAVALVATASPASALAWPTNGWFQISGMSGGGASWQIDEYGIANGRDVNEAMNNDLYYPIATYAQGEYLFCGATDGSDATLTEEANGDITIDCEPDTDAFGLGLTGTLHIRLYDEADTGYLARVWAELENTTGSTITIGADDPVATYYYYNYNAWENGDPWQTNVGGGDYGLDGSVWGAGGDVNNDETATSSVWADLSQSCRIKAASNGMYFPADANVIEPGQTVNLISFINMIFPATNDAAGTTAAFEAAVAHAQGELSQGLTGRLAAGLPSGIVASGWEQNDACVETLPNTGVDSASATAFTAGAIALGMFGLGFVVVARRRARA